MSSGQVVQYAGFGLTSHKYRTLPRDSTGELIKLSRDGDDLELGVGGGLRHGAEGDRPCRALGSMAHMNASARDDLLPLRVPGDLVRRQRDSLRIDAAYGDPSFCVDGLLVARGD